MKRTLGYIVVEGPIGVGKTSLTKRLGKDLSAYVSLEKVSAHPFLEKFYSDPEKFALPTQLFFLVTRIQQVREFKQTDMFNTVCITDFLVEKDRLFAELNLDAPEFALYDEVYGNMTRGLLSPDLVIYLQAPVEVLMRRIEKRGRAFERGIEEDYLDRISAKMTDFFYRYQRAPLLIVNAAEANFVASDSDYQQLFDAIYNVQSGRYFLNPMASGDRQSLKNEIY